MIASLKGIIDEEQYIRISENLKQEIDHNKLNIDNLCSKKTVFLELLNFDLHLINFQISYLLAFLYAIAQKYNTSVDELKAINNLKSNLLNVGQVLKVPVKLSFLAMLHKVSPDTVFM